jgi:hypothetical protein
MEEMINRSIDQIIIIENIFSIRRAQAPCVGARGGGGSECRQCWQQGQPVGDGPELRQAVGLRSHISKLLTKIDDLNTVHMLLKNCVLSSHLFIRDFFLFCSMQIKSNLLQIDQRESKHACQTFK